MVLSRDRISPEFGNPFVKEAEGEKCQGCWSGTKRQVDVTDEQLQDHSIREDSKTAPGPDSPKDHGSAGVRDSLLSHEVTSGQRNHCGEEQVSARKMTNFSIDQILREDFGPRASLPPSAFRRPPSTSSLLSPSSSTSSSPLFSLLFSLPGRSLCFDPFGGPSFRQWSALAGTPCPPGGHRGAKTFSCEKRAKACPRSTFSASSSHSSAAPSVLEKPRPSSKVSHQPQPSRLKQETVARSPDTLTACKTNDSASSPPAPCPQLPLPAWVYCTRYSDRPSSGPRYRKTRQRQPSDKRPRTAFTSSQLQRLKIEFQDCPYLSESRRVALSLELGLSESQVKIWFQNKRAKLKKSSGVTYPLANFLMQEGLYNHSTIVVPDQSNGIDGADSNRKEMTTATGIEDRKDWYN